MFGRSRGISIQQRLRRQNLVVKRTGVRLTGPFDDNLRALKTAVRRVERHSNSDGELGAALRVVGDRHRIERPSLTLRYQPAVDEQPSIRRESRQQFQPRATR
jgi:hypothetical protein